VRGLRLRRRGLRHRRLTARRAGHGTAMQFSDDSVRFLTQGYAWMPDRRRALQRRTVRTRLGGMPAIGLVGPDAARFFYDEHVVRRSGALPEPVVGTLFGKGAVHTLDGEAHRVRKALFVALLMDGGYDGLVERARSAWDDAVAVWAQQREVVLFEESARVLTRAVTGWVGVPLQPDDVGPFAADLQAMVDGFATAGPRHWRARRARGRRERALAAVVEAVREGTCTPKPGSALAAVAAHRDADGELLDARVAAVELLNVIRPTVAVSWFLAFSGHALARWPAHRQRLASGDPAFAEAWGHEVRRFYPFAPFVGGRTTRAVEFDGERVPEGAMVLLDLYGQNHDPALWGDPYAFRPERFLTDDGVVREIGAFELVPQGGGDPRTGHRCPGEQITAALLSALAVRLARLDAEIPDQDLAIPLHRVPTRPRSGVVLRVR
jgi:fatty-acid peroxygenase